jgi:hypothetical protein
MNKLFLLLSILSVSLIAFGQNKDSVQAYIEGYKTIDTIQIDNLLRIGEISIDNNDLLIESFSLVFMDYGFLKEFKATSNKLTEEMRSALISLKARNTKSIKILFEDIVVRTPQNKRSNIGILLYRLKIK